MTTPVQTMPPPPEFMAQIDALEIAFDQGDVEKLGSFLTLLLEANTRFNLTAVRTAEEAWIRHVLDSLTLLPLLLSLDVRTALDLGSGGGLPGIPLAIVLPDLRFTLLEATGKKAKFLDETAAALGLGNVRIIAERAETIGRDREHHREHYDVVTTRAVGPMPVLLELALPLVAVGGHVLAIKGAKAQEEIEASGTALHLLHARVVDTRRSPTGTIVIIEKLRRTPKLYPRRPGEPKRSPLGHAPHQPPGADAGSKSVE